MEDIVIAYALKLNPNPKFPTNGSPNGISLLTLYLKNFKKFAGAFF
jgi:hypothetical protein